MLIGKVLVKVPNLVGYDRRSVHPAHGGVFTHGDFSGARQQS